MPRSLEIPIHHVGREQRDEYFARADFYTHYDKAEANEIGVVIDPKTDKPIFRVVADL